MSPKPATPPADPPALAEAPVEEASPPSWAGYLYVSSLQLAYAFVLYVFSAGPMYWWIFEAYTFGVNPLLQRIYFPLVWLAKHSTWFDAFLDWWIGLWIL